MQRWTAAPRGPSFYENETQLPKGALRRRARLLGSGSRERDEQRQGDEFGEADLVSQAEILRSGQSVGAAAPEPIELGEPKDPPLPHTTRIRLQRFEPGHYELRVTVTDKLAGAIATRRVPFSID